MIPRVRPAYTIDDLRAAMSPDENSIVRFEDELAHYFGVKNALFFPYGRSAIFASFRALGIVGQVVQPAYNCVVVAHATVLSGGVPRFVDCQADDPNQNPDAMIDAIDVNTSAVVPTSIFGMTYDAPALVEDIRRKNNKAFVLMDCAQCFDAKWKGELIVGQGDASVIAFGIGKSMTTLFGGAILTNRRDIAAAVRQYRNSNFNRPSRKMNLGRWAYFLGTWIGLSAPFASLTDWLERSNSPLQDYLQRFRSRDEIRLPKDAETFCLPMQAEIGRAQLARVGRMMSRRVEISRAYDQVLGDVHGIRSLNWVEGASRTIHAVRLENENWRKPLLTRLSGRGIQCDTVLDYVVPELSCYRDRGYSSQPFKNSLGWSKRVINLPNFPSIDTREANRIAYAFVEALRRVQDDEPSFSRRPALGI